MRYFDTSFLTPLVLESTSAAVERFLMDLPAGSLAVSHWTRVEFSSLLAREVRMGGLASDIAREADDEFERIVAESFVVLMPTADDFNLAKRYLSGAGAGLRAGDAFHLAIAANQDAEMIYSLDKTQLEAGRAFGLPVSRGIQLSD